MKDFEEIKKLPRVNITNVCLDSIAGYLKLRSGKMCTVIASIDYGWEHVSIAPLNHHVTPSWDGMCEVKDMFWGEDECVVEYHPPKSEYVNSMPNCLHLWKPIDKELAVPPKYLV